jgi:cell division septation protein DedD
VKPAVPIEHAAKPAPPPKPIASEASAAAKPLAPVKPAPPAKAAEPAAKSKPSAVAAAQPAKPAPAKHAPPAAQRATAEAAEAGPFRIQFGAFAVEDNAHRIQWSVEATGLPVEVVHAPNRKGHMLYYVRSQAFPDHEAAQSAAAAARAKAKSFAQPVALDYVLVSEAAIAAMQGQAPKP